MCNACATVALYCKTDNRTALDALIESNPRVISECVFEHICAHNYIHLIPHWYVHWRMRMNLNLMETIAKYRQYQIIPLLHGIDNAYGDHVIFRNVLKVGGVHAVNITYEICKKSTFDWDNPRLWKYVQDARILRVLLMYNPKKDKYKHLTLPQIIAILDDGAMLDSTAKYSSQAINPVVETYMKTIPVRARLITNITRLIPDLVNIIMAY